MKDVAQRANVSIQTVSAVINGKPGITKETTSRVLGVIQELGYRPFSVARSLRTGQTHTIALVVTDIANPFCATLASVTEDYAHRFGYSLVVYNTHDDVEREMGYIQTAMQRWIDGMLFMATEDKMPSLEVLQTAGIPAVAIERIPEGYSGPSVTLDNVKAGHMAAEHLLELGHTRLAHISGPLRLRVMRERQLGFCQALEARGLSLAACAGGEGNWACIWGYQAMQRLLECRPRPTAVFAANDRMAIGAMRAIYEAGLRVPDDIAVIGMDDIEVAAYQVPPLTTVRQSFAQLATLGVQLLLDMLRGAEPSEIHRMIQPELVVRVSTAPPSNQVPRSDTH
jgi:LacI family transcriptional regulator